MRLIYVSITFRDESDELTIKIKAGQHLNDQLQCQLNLTAGKALNNFVSVKNFVYCSCFLFMRLTTILYPSGRIQDNEKQHKQLTEERLKVLTQHRVHSEESSFSKIKIYQNLPDNKLKFGKSF